MRFIELCRLMGLLTSPSVAIDGSKFKAVNTRDKNFTRRKVERRRGAWTIRSANQDAIASPSWVNDTSQVRHSKVYSSGNPWKRNVFRTSRMG